MVIVQWYGRYIWCGNSVEGYERGRYGVVIVWKVMSVEGMVW